MFKFKMAAVVVSRGAVFMCCNTERHLRADTPPLPVTLVLSAPEIRFTESGFRSTEFLPEIIGHEERYI
jgi:hypothetical protein